jgi:hypothetical protein
VRTNCINDLYAYCAKALADSRPAIHILSRTVGLSKEQELPPTVKAGRQRLPFTRDEFHLAAIVQNLKTMALRIIRPPDHAVA